MSQEFMPAAFSFSASARVLCVGSAAVYRVALSLSGPSSKSSSTSSTDAASTTSTQEWVIAMSQAKFSAFLTQVHAILEHPDVQNHLGHITAQTEAVDLTAVEWRPFDAFMQLMASLLARHAALESWAFSSDAASAAVVNDARAGLEQFLTDGWRSLETVLPALVTEPYDESSTASREVLCLYLLLRDLLAFPESVLAANCAYASAILSLEELTAGAASNGCSICLETVASCQEAHEAVQLPCSHVFHENCIMAWLRQSATCPQCRAPVGLTPDTNPPRAA